MWPMNAYRGCVLRVCAVRAGEGQDDLLHVGAERRIHSIIPSKKKIWIHAYRDRGDADLGGETLLFDMRSSEAFSLSSTVACKLSFQTLNSQDDRQHFCPVIAIGHCQSTWSPLWAVDRNARPSHWLESDTPLSPDLSSRSFNRRNKWNSNCRPRSVVICEDIPNLAILDKISLPPFLSLDL